MKKLIQFFIPVSILIFSVFWLSGFSVQSVQTNLFGNEDSSTVENADSVSIDMTEFYIKLNSDPNTKPSESFRPGHVTPRQIDNYLKKTDYGYVITMGSYTNVPTPVVKDGTVYVSGGFGSKQFYAFDALSGQNIWAINLDDDGPSSPAVEDSIIVFNTESCTIFACNIKTGEHLWSYWLGDPLMCMPTIANGIVFTSYPAGYNGQLNLNQNINMQQNDFNISGNASKLNDSTVSMNTSHVFIAMDLYTGKILWQSRIDGDVMTAPVAKDDYIYATTFPGTLFQFEQKTGKIISVKGLRATSAPVIFGDDIFISKREDQQGEYISEGIVSISSTDDRARIFTKKEAPYLDKDVQNNSNLKKISMSNDAGNGFVGGAPSTSGWAAANENVGQSNVSSLQSFQGSRTLHRDGKNYNTMGDELICIDTETGEVLWKNKIEGDLKSVGGFIGTPPLSVGDFIIIATYSGKIIISDAESGKEIESYDIKEPIRYQPVADNGWIYVTSTTGKLHGINTNNKKITGWTHWGADASRSNMVK